MSSVIASSRLRTSSCMRALASGGKYLSTYLLPEGVAEQAVGRFDAALPARLELRRTAQVAAEEREVLFTNGDDERIGRGREDVPLQVGLPIRKRRLWSCRSSSSCTSAGPRSCRRRGAGGCGRSTTIAIEVRNHRPSTRRRTCCGRSPAGPAGSTLSRNALRELRFHPHERRRAAGRPTTGLHPASVSIETTCAWYLSRASSKRASGFR